MTKKQKPQLEVIKDPAKFKGKTSKMSDKEKREKGLTDPNVEESEIFVSSSSVDNPPKLEKEDKKSYVKVDDKPKGYELFEGERKFEVEFAITLKPIGGKAIKIPLLAEELRGTIVHDAMHIALRDRRNLQVIDAVLDNPQDRSKLVRYNDDGSNSDQAEMF